MSRPPRTGWAIYWTAWLVLGFLVPEIYAIVNHEPGDTFSEYVWFLRDLGSFFMFLIMAILAWLIFHFGFENRRK